MSDDNTAQAEVNKLQQEFKSHVGVISRQSGVFFAGTMFTAVAGYVFKIYLARTLGSEALGIYAMGMTVAGLFGVFGALGINTAAQRYPAVYASTGRGAELRAFVRWALLIVCTVNGVLAGGVVLARRWVSIRLYHTPALAGYLYLFALILFSGALTTFFGQLLTGFKQTATRTIIANFAGVFLNIVFAVALISAGTGLWGYVVAQLASAFVVLVLLVWATRKRIAAVPSVASTGKIVYPKAEMLSFAAAAFAMDLTAFLYAQTDKVILGSYLNARMLGIYSVAATIVAFVPIALQSVNQIFSPTIAELHARGQIDLLNRLYQTLTKWVFGMTLPLAAVVVIFARILMRVFGPDFEQGWVILVIGVVGQLVNAGTGSVGYLLLMSGNERRLMWIYVAMAAVTVLSCLLLVPRFGMTGAAIATAGCNVLMNFWCLAEVRKNLRLFPYNRSYGILAVPSLVMIAATLGLRFGLRSVRADIPVLMLSTIIAYVLFFSVVLLIGLKAEDRMIASAIWARVRASLPVLRGSES